MSSDETEANQSLEVTTESELAGDLVAGGCLAIAVGGPVAGGVLRGGDRHEKLPQ